MFQGLRQVSYMRKGGGEKIGGFCILSPHPTPHPHPRKKTEIDGRPPPLFLNPGSASTNIYVRIMDNP